jgi:hypothetical protein
VHDAFLIEALNMDIEDAAATLKRIMGDASEAVLGAGYRIGSDVEIARWPDAYREEEGLELFNILIGESDQIADRDLPRLLAPAVPLAVRRGARSSQLIAVKRAVFESGNEGKRERGKEGGL